MSYPLDTGSSLVDLFSDNDADEPGQPIIVIKGNVGTVYQGDVVFNGPLTINVGRPRSTV